MRALAGRCMRVMTVHGAKGLEAPIVIVADTTTRPAGPRDVRVLPIPSLNAPQAPPCLVWAQGKAEDVPPRRQHAQEPATPLRTSTAGCSMWP